MPSNLPRSIPILYRNATVIGVVADRERLALTSIALDAYARREVHPRIKCGLSVRGQLRFTVLLPRREEHIGDEVTTAAPTLQGGTERILVVEDEPAMRVVVRRMLERLGYKVLEAGNGAEALGILDTTRVRIDLVLTDMVMPDVDGRLLAECVVGGNRAPRVLCMSGYPDDVLRRGLANPGLVTLQKPFTLEALARAVRDILGDQPSSSS